MKKTILKTVRPFGFVAILALVGGISSVAHAECTSTPIEGGTRTVCTNGGSTDNVNINNNTYSDNNGVVVNQVNQGSGSFDMSQLDSLLGKGSPASSAASLGGISFSSSLFHW